MSSIEYGQSLSNSGIKNFSDQAHQEDRVKQLQAALKAGFCARILLKLEQFSTEAELSTIYQNCFTWHPVAFSNFLAARAKSQIRLNHEQFTQIAIRAKRFHETLINQFGADPSIETLEQIIAENQKTQALVQFFAELCETDFLCTTRPLLTFQQKKAFLESCFSIKLMCCLWNLTITEREAGFYVAFHSEINEEDIAYVTGKVSNIDCVEFSAQMTSLASDKLKSHLKACRSRNIILSDCDVLLFHNILLLTYPYLESEEASLEQRSIYETLLPKLMPFKYEGKMVYLSALSFRYCILSKDLNRLTQLIQAQPFLKEVTFTSFLIPPKAIERIILSFQSCPQLKKLDIGRYEKDDWLDPLEKVLENREPLDDLIFPIISSIGLVGRLSEFRRKARDKNFPVSAIIAIAIYAYNHIQNLSHNVTSENEGSRPQKLKQPPVFKEIRIKHPENADRDVDLAPNDLGVSGIRKLSACLKDSDQVTSLNLQGMLCPGKRVLDCCETELFKDFYTNMGKMTQLKQLDLSSNPFSEENQGFLAQGLKNLNELESFTLNYCSFSSKGYDQLLSALKNKTKLRVFRFRSCCYSSLLPDTLKNWPLLEDVALIAHKSHDFENIKSIIMSLQTLKNLKRIDVSHTVFNEDCIQLLAEGFKEWEHLEVLNIHGISQSLSSFIHGISQSLSLKSIIENLGSLPKLNNLKITDNRIKKNERHQLLKEIENLSDFDCLEMDDPINGMTEELLLNIKDLCIKKPRLKLIIAGDLYSQDYFQNQGV